MNDLYYGHPCSVCGGVHNEASHDIAFSPAVVEDYLRKIYDGFDASTNIEPTVWREILKVMNRGAVEGLSQSSTPPTHEEDFLRSIRHSNEVFSAFKAQAWGRTMQERLLNSEGKLRSFTEWKKEVEPISRHHVGAWLHTEYDTAVLRAHQASDWLEFERNKDILPNLQWMPTTSPSPEAGHRLFWEKPLILPVGDVFWQEHRPGDRWNCKCSLEATDDDISPLDVNEQAEARKPQHSAQAGLEGNPVHKGLITDKHPYYPKSCAVCPFNKGGSIKAWMKEKLLGKIKECHACPYMSEAIEQARKGDAGIYRSVEKEEFGDRFKISTTADLVDLEDNKRVARAILRSDPNIEVSIRSHSTVRNVKNPELLINGAIADNKRIQGEEGITDAFRKAKKQGCSIVVIDLDAEIKRLWTNDLKKYIERRRTDFKEGAIEQCVVVFNGRAVFINGSAFEGETEKERKNAIQSILEQLK